MSIIMDARDGPIAARADAAIYYKGQIVIKSNTAGQIALSAGIADEIVGVIDKTSTDVRGFVKATQTGQAIGIHTLNSGKVVDVLSVVSQTYNPGDVIYASATAGSVTPAHATSRPIGHFPFWMKQIVVGTTGDLTVPCLLDIPQASALVGA
jgi:hypothetical protein